MKRLVVKTGEYTNKNGENKGQYVNIGRLMENQNGEFIILDPDFNLAGLLMKQNMLNRKHGKDIKDGLMVSVFADDNQQQAPSAAQNHAQAKEDFPW